jgi:hypothetical protein
MKIIAILILLCMKGSVFANLNELKDPVVNLKGDKLSVQYSLIPVKNKIDKVYVDQEGLLKVVYLEPIVIKAPLVFICQGEVFQNFTIAGNDLTFLNLSKDQIEKLLALYNVVK